MQVWATDLWISASENVQRVRDAGVEENVFPINADARALPFAGEFFDAIVSVDSFSYYGSDGLYLNYLAQFIFQGAQSPRRALFLIFQGMEKSRDGFELSWPVRQRWVLGSPFKLCSNRNEFGTLAGQSLHVRVPIGLKLSSSSEPRLELFDAPRIQYVLSDHAKDGSRSFEAINMVVVALLRMALPVEAHGATDSPKRTKPKMGSNRSS